LPVEPRVADAAAGLADRDQLERGFRRLSLDHRAIVVLHHYVGLPLPEAAAALGIPPATAKSRYHHAMSALRASLEADGRLVATGEVSA
jgi:RNA polymerase sigma-70 factor (ECF subfamily)